MLPVRVLPDTVNVAEFALTIPPPLPPSFAVLPVRVSPTPSTNHRCRSHRQCVECCRSGCCPSPSTNHRCRSTSNATRAGCGVAGQGAVRHGQRAVVENPSGTRREPFSMVSPEIAATVPTLTLKMRDVSLPLTASTATPGPVIVMLWVIAISPEVSVITLHAGDRPNVIVSPDPAAATGSRNDPAPESAQLVTVTSRPKPDPPTPPPRWSPSPPHSPPRHPCAEP